MLVTGTGVLGTLPAWLTFAGVVAAAWLFYRGGGATAVSGLQGINHELERQIKQKDGQIAALERINAELRAEKDVAVAILPALKMMEVHETRAQQRFEKTLTLIDLIARRLGHEPNGRADISA